MNKFKSLHFFFNCCLALVISISAFQGIANAKTLSSKEYQAQAINLFKEIKDLKKRGLLYNDCGVGACAPNEVKQWYKKWQTLNATKCDGILSFETELGDIVLVADLYDIVTGAYSDKGTLALYKFQSAVNCFESPSKCKN